MDFNPQSYRLSESCRKAGMCDYGVYPLTSLLIWIAIFMFTLSLANEENKAKTKQDLVLSVKLHFGLTLYPLSLPLVPYPLVLFLSRNLDEGCYCHSCDCPQQK